MLASLSGSLALAAGLAVMLLPLLSPELSRPRDAAWGGVVLVLGLTLVTSADRLTGAPMLAVLCGGLLIGRLGGEVAQLRWRQLTPEEQQGLASRERWQRSTAELSASLALLGSTLAGLTAALRGGGSAGKRWVRPEGSAAPAEASEAKASSMVVTSFAEIDALIAAAEPGPDPGPADPDNASGQPQPSEAG